MHITEILITGYDGDSGVFATNVSPDRAQTMFLDANAGEPPTVESVRDMTTTAFDALLKVLEELGVTTDSKVAAA